MVICGGEKYSFKIAIYDRDLNFVEWYFSTYIYNYMIFILDV